MLILNLDTFLQNSFDSISNVDSTDFILFWKPCNVYVCHCIPVRRVYGVKYYTVKKWFLQYFFILPY